MTNIQAINLLKGLEQSLDDYCELNDEGKTAFRMAVTALEVFGISEQLPSAQPEPQWIPCSERLPEEKQDVLLLMSQNMVVGFWEDVLSDGDRTWYANSGNGYFTDMDDTMNGYDDPIAWMPLPTYEGVKE